MGDRRMISRMVISSDAFFTLSYEAQALYFQLTVEADDRGFVSAPKRIAQSMNLEEKTVDELIDRGFAYKFETGVLVLRHWHVANKLKNDRSNKVLHQREFSMLRSDDAGIYHLDSTGFQMIPMESHNGTQEEQERITEGEPFPHAQGFKPPTVEEAAAFAKAEGHPEFDAGRFVEYYTGMGWTTPQGNPVTDWRRKARDWIARDERRSFGTAAPVNKLPNPATNYQQRDNSSYDDYPFTDLSKYSGDAAASG